MDCDIRPIDFNESFSFSCAPDVPCFNECCRDLNHFLTPYDIIQLKNHLKLPSYEFIDQYCCENIGPESGLPIISLNALFSDKNKCPFVTSDGCMVYEARPSSCRMYPLMRAVSRCRKTGKLTEHYAIMKEPHCKGFDRSAQFTPDQWIKDQGLETCNQLNDMMMDIISLKNQFKPGPLGMRERLIFHLGLYDIDRFRQKLSDTDFLKGLALSSERVKQATDDDLELLKIGMMWVKQELFER